MRKRILLLLALFNLSAFAADNLLTNGDFENGMSGWELYKNSTANKGELTIEEGDAPSGSKYLKASVTAVTAENWQIQLQPPAWSCENGAEYNLSFWAKGTEDIHVGVTYGEADDYGYKDGSTYTLTDEWTEIAYSFTSDREGEKAINVNFYVGDAVGEYYFDNFTLVKSDFSQSNYYKDANKRINAIRKNDLNVTVLDAAGKAISDAKVKINMKEPAFKWGTCLAFKSKVDEDETWYRETALKYFQTGVFENDFKWEEFERNENDPNYDKTDLYTTWGNENGWDIRGHALTWGIEKYGFDAHWSRQEDSAYFAKALKNRIDRDLKYYEGTIKEYDVWNEPFHEQGVFQKFGYSLFDSAHVWAKKADPNADLFVNEYSVVAGGATETYYEFIKDKIDKNVPIDGIGVQSHFYSTIDADASLKRIDRLSEFNLPIKVTEFDINVGESKMTEKNQAINTAKFMRAAFSHPAVTEFLFWGFWDARHWVDGGGIFNSDKTPKMAADSVYNLIHNEWSTNEEIATDANGKASTRAFYGTYTVSVEINGTVKEYEVELVQGSSLDVKITEGATEAETVSTGIEDVIFTTKGNSIEVAPNPMMTSNATAMIKVVDAGKYTISIFNTMGDKVNTMSVQLQSGKNSVPVTVQSSGIYFISLEKDGKIVSKFSGSKL